MYNSVGRYGLGVKGGNKYGRERPEVLSDRAKTFKNDEILDQLKGYQEIYNYVFKGEIPDRIKYQAKKKIRPCQFTGMLFFKRNNIIISRYKDDINLIENIDRFDKKNVIIDMEDKSTNEYRPYQLKGVLFIEDGDMILSYRKNDFDLKKFLKNFEAKKIFIRFKLKPRYKRCFL